MSVPAPPSPPSASNPPPAPPQAPASPPTPSALLRFQGRLSHYAGSTIVLQLFRLIYAYVKPKFLSPALLGLWNLLSLAPTYASHLHFGSRTAMAYAIPRLLSEGREQEAADHAATVYAFTLAMNIMLALVLGGLAVFGPWGEETRWGLACAAALVMLNWYHDMQTSMLKAHGDFRLITRNNAFNAVLLITVNAPLVVFFGIYGVFLGVLATKAVLVVWLRLCNPMRRGGRFRAVLLRQLIGQGLPIMAFTFGLLLLATTDRLLIAGLLNTEALGYYAIAVIVSEFLMKIPVATRDMQEPRLMAALAHEDRRVVWDRYLRRPLLTVAVHVPILIAAAVFLIEDALALLLPKYLPSAAPTMLLAFGVYFLALMQVMRGIIVAEGWQLRVLPMQVVGLLVNAGLAVWLVGAGWGIEGVALSSSVSFGVVFLLLLAYVLARSPYDTGERRGIAAAALLPFMLALILVPGLFRAAEGLEAPHLLLSVIKLVLFTGAALALALAIRRWQPDVRMMRWRRGQRS